MSKRQAATDGDGSPSKRGQSLEAVEDDKRLEEVAKSRIESIICTASDTYEEPSDEQLQEVVTLCAKYPSLSTRQFLGGWRFPLIPLNFLLEYGAGLETIKSFCQSSPKAPEIKCCSKYPLEVACTNPRTSSGVIPFLVQVFPDAVGWEIESDYATHTCNSIAHVLLYSIQTPGRLEDVKALLEAESTSQFLRTAENQQHLLNLALENPSHEQQDVTSYIISRCPLATRCEFRPFSDGDIGRRDIQVPMTLPMACLLPQLVKLELHIYWTIDDKDSWQNFTDILGRTHRLEYLDLNLWRPNHRDDGPASLSVPAWIWTLLFDAISTIPRLQKLCLRRNKCFKDGADDITNALVSLLERNTLKTLHLEGFHPASVDIAGALKTNKSLRYINLWSPGKKLESQLLDVLKELNTTLATVNTSSLFVWEDEEDENEEFGGLAKFPRSVVGKQIAYLCILNCCGRARARDPATPVGDLVCLLDTVNEESWRNSAQKVGCLYGLLGECPTIWAVLP